MRKLLLSVLTLFAVQPSLAQLTDTEQLLADYIDLHHDEAIELLIDVVNINSGTQNFAGVAEVGRIFRQRFDE